MPLITINQMQKYYGDNHVLKGVDLDIDMGEVISIIGRSGSGKSTLLRCINGLEGYQEGSIKLGGMTITNRDSQAREISRSIGMVFHGASQLKKASRSAYKRSISRSFWNVGLPPGIYSEEWSIYST